MRSLRYVCSICNVCDDLFFFQAEDGIRDLTVTGVQTCALPICGRDSPAVFGAGQHALRARRSERELRPVSISYPVGDPGREDELIAAIADSWSTPVDWLDIRGIPFFDRPAERAAGRDEPYEPLYETLHRALAQASRAQGAHVVLDGWGGGQLFGADRSYLADLLRTRRWTRSGEHTPETPG